MENPTKVFGVVIAVIIAILFYQSFSPGYKKEDLIITAWQSYIRRPHRKFENLVVGTNSDLDLIVSGVELLESLKVPPGRQKNHESLNSLVDLQEAFHFFLSRGAGGERPFLNKPLFNKIVKSAEKLAKREYAIGGNAAIIADKVADMFPNVIINFVGPVGPHLLDMFEKSVTVALSSRITTDEVHLILEYRVNETWGDSRSPIASRFITSHDELNSGAVLLEPFLEAIHHHEPDLVILSGLHMIESKGEERLNERIRVLTAGLANISMTIPIHLELASMANEKFVRDIVTRVVPHISSLGLNEQEMALVAGVSAAPHRDIFDSKNRPEIHKISDMILWLLRTYGHSDVHPDYRLTRIHFHSLHFHIIGVAPMAWKNLIASVSAGTRLAGRQACDHEELTSDEVELRIVEKFSLFTGDVMHELDATSPVISWEREGFYFVFSPVLVCRHPVKTVGLGDSISAAGLMFSDFNPYFYKH